MALRLVRPECDLSLSRAVWAAYGQPMELLRPTRGEGAEVPSEACVGSSWRSPFPVKGS